MPRGMRFGLCTDQNLPFETLVERWQLFERLGYDSVWDCDHFNQPSRPTGPYYEGWTLLAGLAARTSRIRIGVLVSCNTFRHPGPARHEAMTVDHISNGRLELGLGAGWFVPEHEQFGIPLPPPGELVGRFREAVEIVDGLLRHGHITFAGKYYRLTSAHVPPEPRPAAAAAPHAGRPQAPHAPDLRRVRGRVELVRDPGRDARAQPDPRRALRGDRPGSLDDLAVVLWLGVDDERSPIRGRASALSTTWSAATARRA